VALVSTKARLDREATKDNITGGWEVFNDILSHHAILSGSAASKSPEQILILHCIRYEDIASRSGHSHLKNLVRGQTVRATQGSVASTLDVATKTNTGILSGSHDTTLAHRIFEDITPLLTATNDKHIFSARISAVGRRPEGFPFDGIEASGPNGQRVRAG
jgi:hypothetical protein